jgi:hypothetical protein
MTDYRKIDGVRTLLVKNDEDGPVLFLTRDDGNKVEIPLAPSQYEKMEELFMLKDIG